MAEGISFHTAEPFTVKRGGGVQNPAVDRRCAQAGEGGGVSALFQRERETQTGRELEP